MSILLAQNLEKSYRKGNLKIPVLRGVNLEINEGDFVSIRGSSGTGKSTLLNVIGGLDDFDSGSLIVHGKNILDYRNRGKMHYYRSTMTGFIFQHHYLMPDFTVEENVMMSLRIRGIPAKIARTQARDILEQTGILHRADHLPSQISGGESQRAAVARALAGRPALVLADEPTGNLDAENRHKFIDLISDLQEKFKLTILVVTHEEELAQAAGKKLFMEDGVIYDDIKG